jgi:DNA polymerase-3 subunit gamma/tau
VALALYRKYRPRTFAEVIGQEHVTEPLSQALRTGRLHHAYLFSGPRGCGKTSSARILARSLNCEKGPTPDPCGECASCRSLANEGAGSIDVIEIDAASHGGVDDARELRERAVFAPVSSRYKIYVIDEAHMVSPAGFNALLKLVEEPPDYVMFIFATTEPEKVLGTIKSRTHHYPFRLIPPGVLRPYLETLCQQEGVAVEPAVFPLVVRAGAGSARDSLSVLDQLIAGAGPEGVTYARAVGLLGVTDVSLIDEMCDALAAGDGAAAYATIDRVAEAGHDARRFASDLLERLRDLIILQQVPDAVAKGLLDASADQLDRMAGQAQRIGAATLSRCADIVHNGLVEMRGTTAPRLLLELVCARMLLPGADDSGGALLQRLERMERRLTLSGGAEPDGPATAPASAPPAGAGSGSDPPDPGVRPEPRPAPPVPLPSSAEPARAASTAAEPPAEPAPPPAAAPAKRSSASTPGGLDAAAVRRVWDEILTQVARRSKRAAAVVREATVREVDGDTLVLVFRHSVHANMLTASPELLLDALYEVLGGRWEIRCEVGGDTRGGDARGGGLPGGGFRAAAPAASVTGAAQGGVSATGPVQGGASATGAASGGAPGAGPSTPAHGPGEGGSSQAADGATGPAADGDWPETARLGGGSGTSTADPDTATAGRPPKPRAAETAPTRPNGGRRGRAAAGESAAARVPRRGARGDAGPGEGGWDGPPPDEPPHDPDYDGSVGGRRYDGFDPGDEPIDDVIDEAAARQTSEQQALQLLQQHLGAEKIGEVDAR